MASSSDRGLQIAEDQRATEEQRRVLDRQQLVRTTCFLSGMSPKSAWEERLTGSSSTMSQIMIEMGNCLVPATYVTKTGFKLGVMGGQSKKRT